LFRTANAAATYSPPAHEPAAARAAAVMAGASELAGAGR
jgi:hypothetical protein